MQQKAQALADGRLGMLEVNQLAMREKMTMIARAPTRGMMVTHVQGNWGKFDRIFWPYYRQNHSVHMEG